MCMNNNTEVTLGNHMTWNWAITKDYFLPCAGYKGMHNFAMKKLPLF